MAGETAPGMSPVDGATALSVVDHGFASRPDGPAVVDDTVALTRSQLDRASRRVAQRCAQAGVGPAHPCFALVPLDADGVVGTLGAIRSGATVVHLDPALPEAYLREIAQRTGALVAVVTPDSAPLAAALGLTPVLAGAGDASGEPGGDMATALAAPTPDDAARIRFTSGSTGRPKGVVITHAQDVRSLRRTQHGPAGQRRALLIPFGPTAPRHAVLGAVTAGFVVCPFDVRRLGLERLIGFLDDHEVEFVRTPVGLFRSLVATLGERRLTSVRALTMTGEAIAPSDLRAFAAHFPPDAWLEIGYGSSETGRLGTLRLRAGDPVPDGPVVYPPPPGEARVRIERADGTPADPLEVGEIVALGGRVLRSYVDDPELSAARFFVDGDGTPGYRTGDLGRLHPHGLEVVGRNDDQVTVRGSNVHLRTVEAALREAPGVTDCAVVARTVEGRGAQLVAAVVAGPAAPTGGRLREVLAEALPSHMVPQRFVAVDELPRLPGGKLDREALQARLADAVPLGRERPYRAPATPDEQAVAALFADVLGIDRVGLDDDFFDLGGDSLAAEELVARLAARTGGRLTRGAVLDCPTAGALALRLGTGHGTGPGSDGLVCLHPGGTGTPLFVAPGGGQEPFDLVRLAHRLGADRPVYSYRSPLYDRRGRPDRSVADLARAYERACTTAVGAGPVLIAGYSAGAAVALELVRRLRAGGRCVPLFVSLDGAAPAAQARSLRPWRELAGWRDWRDWRDEQQRLRTLPPAQRVTALVKTATRRPRAWWMDRTLGLVRRDRETQMALLFQSSSMARARYTGSAYDGPAVVVVSQDASVERRDVASWQRLLHGPVTRVHAAGDHHAMLQEPHVAPLCDALAPLLRDADREVRPGA